jgi:hypothetical protein
MKTKLSLLFTALAFASVASLATAGPSLDQLHLRKQIADANRSATVVRDSDYRVTYTPSPSGKGGLVARRDANVGSANIALFKSHKKDACCAKH